MATNSDLVDFQRDLTLRFPIEGKNMGYAEYAEANTQLRGVPFSFENYSFQREIMNDMSPDLTVIKISQVGITELMLRKAAIFAKRNAYTTVLYTLPNDDMLANVSQTRFAPLLNGKGSIFTTPGGLKRVGVYQIDNSFVYMSGMTEGDATSTPGDVVMHDEYDLSDMDIIGQFPSRLQNSPHRITQRFSTPTFPGAGVDALYEVSNQTEYMVKCSSCNHHQVPIYDWKHIKTPDLPNRLREIPLRELTRELLIEHERNYQTAHFCCVKCGNDLTADIANPEQRQWVAKHPSRLSVGRRVRPSSSPKITVPYLFGRHRSAKISDTRAVYRKFINTALGEAYSDGDSEILEERVRTAMKSPKSPEVSSTRSYTIGIDVGTVCHIVVLDITDIMPKIVLMTIVSANQLEEKVVELQQKYNLIAGAVDRYPYTPTAVSLQSKTGNIVTPVHYLSKGGVSCRYHKEENYIQADRTTAIDAVKGLFDSPNFEAYGYGDYSELVIKHMTDSYRVEVPEKPATWQKKTGHDHFLHALTFAVLSIKIREVLDASGPKVKESELNVMVGFANLSQPNSVARPQTLLPPATSSLLRS